MKRFYRDAGFAAVDGGWQVRLDARALSTPKRAPLLLPAEALAAAVAAEWNAQGERIQPATMPMTGLANAAIDHVMPDPAAFAGSLAAYAASDLVCYRADAPDALVQRQCAAWDPVVAFIRRRFDAELVVTTGIQHVAQPAATLERLRAALDTLSPFQLAGLQPVVTISGSLVIALMLAEGAIDTATAFAAGQIDELFQAEMWGDDDDARMAREGRRRDFDAASRFLTLL